jgi:hypothetical protein
MTETVPESYPVATVFRPLTFLHLEEGESTALPWKMKAVSFFETLSATQQTTWHHIPEELNPRRWK